MTDEGRWLASGPGDSAQPFTSAQWFRLAGLRPAIGRGVRVDRTVARGQVWHLLVRADGTRSVRLSPAAWAGVGRCDGRRTVQQLWECALSDARRSGQSAPTQDEWIAMLARLEASALLSFDRVPDFGADAASPQASPDAAHGAQAAREGGRDPQRSRSLLAWQIPLGRPDRWLALLARAVAPLFSPTALALWLVAVAAMAVQAFGHADLLTAQLQALLASPHGAWLLAGVVPIIKVLHELAHGAAARRFGAPVPSWGVAFLMLLPVPYVDAGAAAALPRRRHRMVVAGAGIAVETALAAIALPIALTLQPGPLREVALAVFFVGALSTLLVNANPLLRFDGYHLLCDALSLPNLAVRSTRWWREAAMRTVARAQVPSPLQPAAGERIWLWSYAPAALAMRWAIALGIVWWAGSVSRVVGLGAAALMAWSMLIKPGWALARWIGRLDESRARRRAMFATAAVLAAFVAVPLPWTTIAQGVLWQPETALLRASEAGVVAELLVDDGAPVEEGTPVARLLAPALQAEGQRLDARLDALRSQHLSALVSNPVKAASLAHEMDAALAEATQGQTRSDALILRARTAGHVAFERPADWPGRAVARGDLIAHIVTREPGLVQVAVPQERAADVAQAVAVPARTAEGRLLRAQRVGAWSGGVRSLPTGALAERAGGAIATDPEDDKGLRTLRPVALAQFRLDEPTGRRLGQRVWLRFDQGWAPLAWQALVALQRQVLHAFNPGR